MIKKGGNRQIRANVYRYVKENSSKGHSLNSIKKWLIMYGYDENFVSKLIKEFHAKQFVKEFLLSSLIVAMTLFFVSLPIFDQNITGAVIGIGEAGCCIDNAGLCRESYPKENCISEGLMYIRHDCFDLPYCEDKTST